VLLGVFFALLLASILVAPRLPPLGAVTGAFYRTGALVFGGGHVVLPLLKQAIVEPGWVDSDTFLAGYGAAQAVPGPMFSFSVYLGEQLEGGHGGVSDAVACLLAIFLPGLLLISGALPFLVKRAGRQASFDSASFIQPSLHPASLGRRSTRRPATTAVR
jgi:chromate transporter